MRDSWIPRPNPELEIRTLDLDPEEGFILSRLDGATSVRDLRVLTGLSDDRLTSVLERLQEQGALVERVREVVTGSDERADRGADRGADERADESADDGAGHASTNETRSRSWRRILEEELRPLDPDARVARARDAVDDTLRALCFDPSRRVVVALLENPRFGLEHARLVATHHRSSQGLDALGEHVAFLRDRQVERHLLRNTQTSARLLRKLFARARMAKIYRLAVGHDATERVRETCRREFRKKFTAGSSEERTKLILDTEGRCLTLLVGLSLDAKTAGLLRQRALTSTMLIRNLSRWPATPPPLLAHMMRQPQVKRSPALRNLVLRHPNAPSELKRGL